MSFDIFNEIDRINAEYKKRYMPETETDPECRPAEFQERIDKEVAYLLDNPERILDVDVDRLTDLFKEHKGNPVELGYSMYQYYAELAEKQAEESV